MHIEQFNCTFIFVSNRTLVEFLNSIFSWLITKRMHQIDLFLKYPHDVQQEWFGKLLQAGTQTEYGKKHGFDAITSRDDFARNIPIATYETLEPYISRNIKGEQNLLWNTEVKWFAKSSGTTAAKSKFIPVSTESLEDCHFAAGKDMVALFYHNNPNSKLFLGRTLGIGGSDQVNQYNSNSYFGDLSAILMKNLPFWVEIRRTPSMEIALLPEWEEKLNKMAETTAKQNVSTIAGVPSWALVLLNKILEENGKDNLWEIWPNLEVFFHGGVSFKPYKASFQHLFPGDQLKYVEIYNASEGFFGIQDRNNANDMLLMLDYGIYYEFLPLPELGSTQPKTLQLHEVELNTNYALIITTNGGLWRYMIGDTIKFTSLDPYRIQVSGRTKHYINTFGEEVIVENAEDALYYACSATNAIVKEYTAAPVYMESNAKNGAHEWAIEFEQQPDDFEKFKRLLDKRLKEVNSDYEAKRYNSYILMDPIVHSVPPGTFYEWMRQRGKLGGQNKVPRLANNREYLEPVLEIAQQLR